MFVNDRTFRITLIVVALLTPALAGCVAPGDGPTGTGAFYVKDAPEDDWQHVNVTFTSVRVHLGNDTGSEEDGEWITVAENETGREIDLLAFSTADARALLGVSELEPGTYNQVLVNVSDAYGIHKDSGDREDFELTRPQLRLTRAWTIEANTTTHLIADIDLDRSIVQQGDGQYRFNPVIGQVIVEQNQKEPGDVRGRSGQPGGDGDGPRGPMTTYVKDAPTDELDEVWLTFDQVEVHYAGNGSEDDNATDGNATEGRWITTVNETRELDLLKYNESGSKAFLGEANLPVGRYTQIRLAISDAWAVTNNGTEVDITVSSNTARVVRTWEVSDNGTTAQVTIDLDLDRSLVKQGASDQDRNQGQSNGSAGDGQRTQWRITPVIGTVLVDHVPVDPKQDQADTQDTLEDATGGGSADGTSGADASKPAD